MLIYQHDGLPHMTSGLARAVPGRLNYFNSSLSAHLRVLLRAVQCSGNEDNILECPYQLNRDACDHTQDAGVICLGEPATTTPTTTTTTTTPSTTTLPPRICTFYDSINTI